MTPEEKVEQARLSEKHGIPQFWYRMYDINTEEVFESCDPTIKECGEFVEIVYRQGIPTS